MLNTDIHYPSARDLEEVLRSYLSGKQLQLLMQTKGIFIFNTKKSDMAHLASTFLYSFEELKVMRNKAYSISNNCILTGFCLTSKKSFDVNAIYNELREGYSSKLNSDYSLMAIHKETTSEDKKVVYRGRLKYRSKKIGRIAFINVEEREVDFRMIPVEDNKCFVEVDGTKSVDGKEVQKILKSAVKQRDIIMDYMELEALTGKKPIEFFDQLAQKGMSDEWSISDIKRITIRKPSTLDSDEEVEDKHLTGIRQAILDGVNLRENPFVKSSEGSFIFTSMTYVFTEKRTGDKLVIRAEFKGNPKIFEVVLEQYLKPNQELGTEEDDFQDVASTLAPKKNLEYRSLFWNNAKVIYDGLINS